MDGDHRDPTLELAVDVGSFTHTAFSIADTDTTDEVISVLETYRRQWGTPLGVVRDRSSANLSENAINLNQSRRVLPSLLDFVRIFIVLLQLERLGLYNTNNFIKKLRCCYRSDTANRIQRGRHFNDISSHKP